MRLGSFVNLMPFVYVIPGSTWYWYVPGTEYVHCYMGFVM